MERKRLRTRRRFSEDFTGCRLRISRRAVGNDRISVLLQFSTVLRVIRLQAMAGDELDSRVTEEWHLVLPCSYSRISLKNGHGKQEDQPLLLNLEPSGYCFGYVANVRHRCSKPPPGEPLPIRSGKMPLYSLS